MEVQIRLDKSDLKPQYKDTPKTDLQFFMFSQDLERDLILRASIVLYKVDWSDAIEYRHIIKSRYKEDEIDYYLKR